MKKIHLLCNAHLDPVWLWTREEAIAEAISTFRVAADFCEKYNGFIFNHNESLLYEWVEEYEPALFERIKRLVAEGKWGIMGGWYLQPDCLMPSAEGFLRQIEVGNRYFIEKFGVKPKTAINFDSFGHARGLVQILKKCGYDSYVFMRPNGIIPENNFIWRGFDGSEILGHAISGGYATNSGSTLERLQGAVAFGREGANLMLWGIGNHGGGPSEEALRDIEDFKKEHPEVEIIHSRCEDYFAEVEREGLKTEERSMVHIFVGCSTTMTRIKQNYRALENELITCEKMLAAAGLDADIPALQDAQKALLFCQFHDILPGTMIKQGETDCLNLLGYGREIVSRLCTKAFFRLCEGQEKGKRGEIPIMVFNPHPYPIVQDIEMEFQLEDQNWTENQVTLVSVRDGGGNYLPTQNEKEASSLNLDWRKKIVFTAKLAPMSINRFDCELHIEEFPKRPIADCEQTANHFIIKTEKLCVWINKKTGLIDKYEACGKDYLKENSAKINVFKDNEDPWLMTAEGFNEQIGEFELLDAKSANEFRGHPEVNHASVMVIENGAVRCKIQAMFKNRNSFAAVTYTIPKNDTYVDIAIKLFANDVNSMYKLSFETSVESSEFVGHTAYGREVMRNNGLEASYQKWCALENDEKCFAVLNRGSFGGSAQNSRLNISLMRTPAYSAHPIADRPLTENDRNQDHIDMGEHDFEYRLSVESDYLDKQAESYNQPAYAFSFFPSGDGDKKNTAICLDNEDIILSSYRKISGGYFFRMFNSSNEQTCARFEVCGKVFELEFSPFEAKAYRLKDGVLTECKTLSGIDL